MCRSRRGSVILYAAVTLVVTAGLASLVVDFGRVQVARAEIATAVDAAVRYAATGLNDGTFLAKAQAAAGSNLVDGTPLVLTADDVVRGTWNAQTRTFTAGGTAPNALRITAQRSAARGNAIATPIASIIGKPNFDIRYQTIAIAAAPQSIADIVGLSAVTLTGGTQIRRVAGENGSVRVGSNGLTSVPWGTSIQGDVLYRSTQPSEPGNGITGNNIQLSENLSYPARSAPSGATNLGALNVGWQGLTLAAGNYVCSSITFGGGGKITFSGDVNLYCAGAVTMGNGSTFDTGDGARKVRLYLTSTNAANFNMSSTFHMAIYGPDATVTLSGSSPLVGAVVVKTLKLEGSANISYSSNFAIPSSGDSSGGSGSGSSSASVTIVR